MINTIIVDDDIRNIRVLKGLLEEFCPQIMVMGEACAIDEAVHLVKINKPDLVFLDIEMPYGDGFELLDRLRPVDFAVIFITAYNNYALRAIKYCALDYLLKPVNIKELTQAIQRVAEQINSKEGYLKLQMLCDKLKFHPAEIQKIAVPAMEGLIFIDMKNIIRCQSQGNYTHIYISTGKKITTTKTIREFEDILPENLFFRVHNSHLVNLNHIKKYFKGRGGYIVMEDNTSIEVASRRKEGFLDRFR